MSSTLQLGSSGPDVAAWQKTIGVPADGNFGPKTQEATQNWQAAHGLKDDGVVGPKTQEKAGASQGQQQKQQPEQKQQQQQQQQPASGAGATSDFWFPFTSPPPVSWHDGKKWFGAPRDGGRLHGGCDIIKDVGEPIHAVANGVLVHEETLFYMQTNYITFQHGPFLIRYGEIMPGSSGRMKQKTPVTKGQVIAKVGQLIDNKGRKKSHMLHFEMYSHGNDWTTLRSERGPYMRRADIIDPAPYLDKWVHNLPPR